MLVQVWRPFSSYVKIKYEHFCFILYIFCSNLTKCGLRELYIKVYKIWLDLKKNEYVGPEMEGIRHKKNTWKYICQKSGFYL